MKLTTCLMLFAFLQVGASGVAQRVSLNENNGSMEKVLKKIGQQTGYTFLYENRVLKKASPVTLKANNASLEHALQLCFQGQPLTYKIFDRTVVIKEKLIQYAMKIEEEQGPVPLANIVKGHVTNSQGEPLVGVSVTIKGTQTGTLTDENGNYSIDAPENATLIFSFVGFTSQEIPVGGRSSIDVSLEAYDSGLDEVVVVGYGTQRRSDLTSAISTVDAKPISKMPIGNATDVLKGIVPGLSVIANSGQPGSSPTVRVRGITSFGASNNPLYVVDGIQMNNINWLNQTDIENIQVLKDAASASVFGVSAAAGVILITTKEGKKGELNFSYKGSIGFAEPSKKLNLLDATEYVMIMNEGFENDNQASPIIVPAGIGKGTNWQEEVFHRSLRHTHNFSVGGGNEKSTYYASFGFSDINGIVLPKISYNRQMNFRLNSSHQIFNFLKVGEEVAYTHRNFQRIDPFYEGNGPFAAALRLDPLTPVTISDPSLSPFPNDYSNPYVVKDDEGNYYGMSHYVDYVNPLGYEKIHLNDYNNSDDFIANFFGELEVKGIKLRTSYSAIKQYSKSRKFTPLYYLNTKTIGSNQGQNNLQQSSMDNFNWSIENTLNYDLKLSKHSFNILLGQGYYESNRGGMSKVLYTGLPIDNAQDASFNYELPSSSRSATNIDSIRVHKASYFGRILYNYDQKYLFTATFRRDGSSRFGPNHHWGNFPSVSVGWRISEENFWPENFLVKQLKIRGGYGVLGNDNIGDFQFASFMVSGVNYTSGNDEVQTGYRLNTLENPDLRWEESRQTDIGIDFSILNNLMGSIDWFNKDTRGILRQAILPGYTGVVDNPFQNIGSMTNKGIELQLNYTKKWSDFNLSVNGNFSYIKNEVTGLELGRNFVDGTIETNIGPVTRIIPGESYNVFIGYKSSGIFQNENEVNNYLNKDGELILPQAKPGDIRWVDSNGDGAVNSDDIVVLGNSVPKYYYGLNLDFTYKNFDLDVFMDGSAGNKILKLLRAYDAVFYNYQTEILKRWTGEGTSNTFPRMTNLDLNENHKRISDLNLYSGNFLRIKRINLGYNLPAKISNRILANEIRVFFSIDNVTVITKYNGLDPEIANSDEFGVDRTYYPQARSYIFGVNVNF